MRLTATRELAVACRLRRDPAQVGVAREQTRKAVADWGLGEHSDVAELIVSELVTNALRHGHGPIEVLLSYSSGKLRVAVHDDAHGRPVRQRASADDERGRGWRCSMVWSSCTAASEDSSTTPRDPARPCTSR